MLESALQLGEGLLRACQISGLQGLTDGVEILLALAVLKIVAVGERAALAQSLQSAEFLLRARQVSGLEGLAKLLQIGLARLKVRLKLLVNRTGRNCGG